MPITATQWQGFCLVHGDEFVTVRFHMNECSDVFPVKLIPDILTGNSNESSMPPVALGHWRVVGLFKVFPFCSAYSWLKPPILSPAIRVGIT